MSISAAVAIFAIFAIVSFLLGVTRHFGVTKDELTRAIERVGNSAAAVRKQLGAAGQDAVLTP